jgi:hypothetical protein
MTDDARDFLLRQFDLAWRLLTHHLDDLTTADCLRRPAERGLHVVRDADGAWRAEWPEHEAYSLGPSSLAWLTWHLDFWWSMVEDHSFGAGTLTREAVTWPGEAEAVRARIHALHDRWRARVAALSAEDLRSSERTRWPFQGRPFGDVVAWVNVELTKSAAEIGYVRFLHGAAAPRASSGPDQITSRPSPAAD